MKLVAKMVAKAVCRLLKRAIIGKSGRHAAFFLFALICFYTVKSLKTVYVYTVEHAFYDQHYKPLPNAANRSAGQCTLPNIDPWDPTIAQFITGWDPLRCDVVQPYLTYWDTDGFLKFNETELGSQKLDVRKLECWYQTFWKTGENDDDLNYSEETMLKRFAFVGQEADFLKIWCYYASWTRIYSNIHFRIRNDLLFLHQLSKQSRSTNAVTHMQRRTMMMKMLNRTMTSERSEKKKMTSERPNVFVFGLDSMSRLNFMRQLNRTYDFLVKDMKSVVLKGLTKLGSNTFPNVVPLLTGRRPYPLEGELVELPGNPVKGFYDAWPFVWKDFSSAGYVTAYAEDLPEYSTFNYLAKGFRDTPTDFYMRPFWLEMYKSIAFWNWDLCFRNRPRHSLLLDWAKEVIDKYHEKNGPYFMFTLLTELSHDYLNRVQIADSDFERFFSDLYLSGKLDNTILIVFGDHGNNFDGIQTTVLGRIEQNMPFLSIHLPKELDDEHPHLRRNLEANSLRLTGWFDIYELLMDVAFENYFDFSGPFRWGFRGLSPFRLLPERSCEEAGIPDNYCFCHIETRLETTDVKVRT